MAGYKIESVDPTTDLTAGGRFVDMYEVAFTTEHGATGKVKVPQAGYSATIVKAAVEPLVAELEATLGLGQ